MIRKMQIGVFLERRYCSSSAEVQVAFYARASEIEDIYWQDERVLTLCR
jgi:hypothetical protein